VHQLVNTNFDDIKVHGTCDNSCLVKAIFPAENLMAYMQLYVLRSAQNSRRKGQGCLLLPITLSVSFVVFLSTVAVRVFAGGYRLSV
jgi:hypothetical protein